MEANELIQKITTEILNPVIGLMIAIAVVVFIWGIIEFIFNADNQQKRESGKKHIIWGLAGLLIIFCVAGIMEIIKNFVGSID